MRERNKQSAPWPGLQWCRGACDDYKAELPWPFKPLHAVGHHLFSSFQDFPSRTRASPSPLRFASARVLLSEPQHLFESLTARFGQQHRLSAEEQGDAEERALAIALSGKQKATLLEFYSPRCTLCQSLLKVVEDVERKEGDWLRIVMADVENKKWLPEASLYEINYVPCFVLLDSQGTALAKTGVPYSRKHVLKGLSYLLESMRPIRGALKRVPVDSGPGSASDS